MTPKEKTRLYFAHSMKSYRTPQELKNLVLIKNRFSDVEIVDPSKVGSSDMQVYFRLVRSCDIFVMTEHNRHVGRGVYEEYVFALNERKEIWLLRQGEFIPKERFALSVFDRHDWGVKFAKVHLIRKVKE